MGYVKQCEMRPINAKEHLMRYWKVYDVVDSKEAFVALLNILQACGENIDTLHAVCFNNSNEFADILHNGCWEDDREVAQTLCEFCTFYTEEEFIDMILSRREDYETAEEWAEEIRLETTDDISGNNDVQISKTEDGYVRRIWC